MVVRATLPSYYICQRRRLLLLSAYARISQTGEIAWLPTARSVRKIAGNFRRSANGYDDAWLGHNRLAPALPARDQRLDGGFYYGSFVFRYSIYYWGQD